MPEAYNYTGYQTLGYPSFVDTSTDVMLVAEPGGTYGIRAVEEGLAVPPSDGRWEAVKSAPPNPTVTAKPAATIPAANEGAAA